MAVNPLERLIDTCPEGESLVIRPLRGYRTINLDLNAACLMRTGRKARMRPRTN
jgi:hypothetical protein